MPKRAQFNREGAIVMGAAGMYARIFSVPELATRCGIPYQTMHKQMSSDFGRVTINNFRAIVAHSAMTDDDIIRIIRGSR